MNQINPIGLIFGLPKHACFDITQRSWLLGNAMSNKKFWWLVAAFAVISFIASMMIEEEKLGDFASAMTVLSIIFALYQWRDQKKKEHDEHEKELKLENERYEEKRTDHQKEMNLRSESIRLTEIDFLDSVYKVDKYNFEMMRSVYDAKQGYILLGSIVGEIDTLEEGNPEKLFELIENKEAIKKHFKNPNACALAKSYIKMKISRDVFMKKIDEYKKTSSTMMPAPHVVQEGSRLECSSIEVPSGEGKVPSSNPNINPT